MRRQLLLEEGRVLMIWSGGGGNGGVEGGVRWERRREVRRGQGGRVVVVVGVFEEARVGIFHG
jgi:hypothetical protein